METVLDVKLADCLGQTPQDFLAVRDAQVRVPLDQLKEGATEIGVHKHIVLVAGVDGQANPRGARKYAREEFRQLVE
jgi:hypothetical protein